MAFGAKPEAYLLNFKTWKLKQVIQAKNELTKVKNKEVLREQKQARVPKTLNPVASQDQSNFAQQRVKAKRRLNLAQELNFSDYLAVYVRRYADDEAKLQELAKKMDTEQVVELLKNYNSTKK